LIWGRTYFAAQAIATWRVAVFLSPFVREATLGSLDPVFVAVFDIPLFVGASAAAALGLRPAAVVSSGWTILVAVALRSPGRCSGTSSYDLSRSPTSRRVSATSTGELLRGVTSYFGYVLEARAHRAGRC
jgi:hypothetical protein